MIPAFQPFEFCLAIFRGLVALAVTLHVLRTKRDTAAAIGWIGVVWLMPLCGGALYLMFGVNRVRRRARRVARRHRRDLRTAQRDTGTEAEGEFRRLSRMLDALTEYPLVSGNAVTCLQDGDNAYPAMLCAIAEARRSVVLCSYIFRRDEVGMAFVEALDEARARGVAVRVLVDGVGSGYFHCGIQRALRQRGIVCRRFMHSFWPWRMPFINLRNHRKILAVDGRIGFMGGLNIGAENRLRSRPRHPVADMHFQLEGPIVAQLTEIFARDWFFACGEELESEVFFPKHCAPVGSTLLRAVPSGPDNDFEKIEYAMLQGITLARESVRIVTPYFLPDERLLTVLCLAALRGVTVDIIVPSRSNHRLIDYARDATLMPFCDAGCRIWLAAPPFNHAKLMVVDRQWCFVGSANVDARSLRLNFEINMGIYSRELADSLAEFVDGLKGRRVGRADLEKLPKIVKLRNASVRLLMPYL